MKKSLTEILCDGSAVADAGCGARWAGSAIGYGACPIGGACCRTNTMPPAISDKATITNSNDRSASVSRGDRSAYQKFPYHDLCGCSGAIAISLSAGVTAQYGMARFSRQSME